MCPHHLILPPCSTHHLGEFSAILSVLAQSKIGGSSLISILDQKLIPFVHSLAYTGHSTCL